jgi:hypothetical protein
MCGRRPGTCVCRLGVRSLVMPGVHCARTSRQPQYAPSDSSAASYKEIQHRHVKILLGGRDSACDMRISLLRTGRPGSIAEQPRSMLQSQRRRSLRALDVPVVQGLLQCHGAAGHVNCGNLNSQRACKSIPQQSLQEPRVGCSIPSGTTRLTITGARDRSHQTRFRLSFAASSARRVLT